MTPRPHPLRCETCKFKLPECDKEALGSRVCKKIFLEDPKALQIGIPYFINIVGCASHIATSRPAPLTQNDNGDCLIICQHCGKVTQVQCAEAALSQCEENGCTGIDNCDEICIHQRIYSQAQMDEKVAQSREDVLDIFDEFLNSDAHLTLYKWEIREKIRSLRTGGDE
jgi:hypothetical protein